MQIESESTAPEAYTLAVQAYTSIEGSEAGYAAQAPTQEPTPTQSPATVEEGTKESLSAAPANDSYGENYILTASNDGQNTESQIVKINIAHNVRLTAYCPCEICCGYWAAIRPVDGYGNKIVYTLSRPNKKCKKTPNKFCSFSVKGEATRIRVYLLKK